MEVIEFIKRRFSIDCNWRNGNCYYFALILRDRFPGGKIFYDVILGHFLYFYKGNYYDWSGIVKANGVLIEWDKFDLYDTNQKKRIIEDCLK